MVSVFVLLFHLVQFQLKSIFSDDEDAKEYEQTMDYRELIKNKVDQAIDEDFGEMLNIPLPEVS